MNKIFEGFTPIFDVNSKILILGSFPSVKSRETNFYYGNKQNKFWKILFNLYGETLKDDNDSKKKFLLRNNIALWDIVSKCEIVGSSDSNLKVIKISDLSLIFKVAKIEKIYCNGKKSYELLCKYYKEFEQFAVYLPSTSPANVKFNYSEWESNFKII